MRDAAGSRLVRPRIPLGGEPAETYRGPIGLGMGRACFLGDDSRMIRYWFEDEGVLERFDASSVPQRVCPVVAKPGMQPIGTRAVPPLIEPSPQQMPEQCFDACCPPDSESRSGKLTAVLAQLQEAVDQLAAQVGVRAGGSPPSLPTKGVNELGNLTANPSEVGDPGEFQVAYQQRLVVPRDMSGTGAAAIANVDRIAAAQDHRVSSLRDALARDAEQSGGPMIEQQLVLARESQLSSDLHGLADGFRELPDMTVDEAAALESLLQQGVDSGSLDIREATELRWSVESRAQNTPDDIEARAERGFTEWKYAEHVLQQRAQEGATRVRSGESSVAAEAAEIRPMRESINAFANDLQQATALAQVDPERSRQMLDELIVNVGNWRNSGGEYSPVAHD